MPRSIIIRDVPAETRAKLAARAARRGQSLSVYLRALFMELARRPDAQILMAGIRQCKETSETSLSSGILDLRDRERR